MRRTITMTAATIGLVIAFVVGGVALTARPAAAGPDATSCIGIDVITVRFAHSRTSGVSTPTVTSLDPSAIDPPDPSDISVNILFPPDVDVDVCGPLG